MREIISNEDIVLDRLISFDINNHLTISVNVNTILNTIDITSLTTSEINDVIC